MIIFASTAISAALLLSGVWADSNSDIDEIYKDMESRMKSLNLNIESQDNPPSTTTPLAILFADNQTAFDEWKQQIVHKFDKDQNGNITSSESRLVAAEMAGGGVAGMVARIMHRVTNVYSSQTEQMDVNDDGVLSTQEMDIRLTDFSKRQIQLPAEYQAVCTTFMDGVNTCDLNGEDEETSQNIASQFALCQSAFTYLMESWEVEECVIRASTASGDKQCDKASLIDCFSRRRQKKPKDISQSPLALPALFKRQVTPVPTYITQASRTTSMWRLLSLSLDLWLLIPILVALTVVAVTVFTTSVHFSSKSSIDRYWHQAADYERWKIGMDLPPCGTPFVYWSEDCGFVNSKKSKFCIRGQPLHRRSCGMWWSNGGRACGFFGCQSLCFDVSDKGCSKTLKYRLGYDDAGMSISVPYQDFQNQSS